MRMDIPEFFNGAFLKKDKINYRLFQYSVFKQCKNKNSLVVLPTGLGKTIIGILLIAERLKKYEKHGKIMILAPTRPLVSQHRNSCVRFLDIEEEEIIHLTGKVTPRKRMLLFNKARIIISTPQVIKNDLMKGRYNLDQVGLIIFDEAHRTKGNYAYNFISKEYISSCVDPLILGLTASPGKNLDIIQELCDNLFVENVVFKSLDDPDVEQYVHGIDVILEQLDLPIKLLELREVWEHLFRRLLRFFIKRDLINPFKKYYSKMDFLRITHDLTTSLNHGIGFRNESVDDLILESLFYQSPRIIDLVREKKLNIQSIFSYCSSCISILHARELLETQEIGLFRSFFERLENKAEQDILSAKRIVNSKHFKYIKRVISKEKSQDLFHPKLQQVISLIRREKKEFNNKKIIIFTQYREMAEFLKQFLREEFREDYVIEKFIGQASKTDDLGFSQDKQIDIIEKFRENQIDVIIATSVAEEGLDIPNVDAIIFYEPVPSEIRFIQRRGRTGRMSPGRCYILITNDTIDVAYYSVSRRKESTMHGVLLAPEELELNQGIKRKRIKVKDIDKFSDYEIIQQFDDRRKREKELLANRSIEEIINQLDEFSRSKEYKRLKSTGITFLSDVVKLDKQKLTKKVQKLNGYQKKTPKPRKRYLNKNVQTLINIAETFSENGVIPYSRFQELAEEEDIFDRKFYIHFNRACYLGYLDHQKHSEEVHFIKSHD